MTNQRICLMVMIKLVQKEGVKYVKNDFMFMKLANIVLNVLGKYQKDNYSYSRIRSDPDHLWQKFWLTSIPDQFKAFSKALEKFTEH